VIKVRVAIYARYSSDRQNERSIDDQVRLCREHVKKLVGAEIVGVYSDYCLSGSHLRSRAEATRLLKDARLGIYDVVLTEALDRLSRDQEDIAGIFKRLTFAGVQLLTIAEGIVEELHIGLKGTMNAVFLRDLAAKIRRGQRGRAADGLNPGGLGYGYEVVHEFDAKGEPKRGLRCVNEEQAAVVRRIFKEYASGRSARMIAQGLNRDRVPSPRGGEWGPSAINGGRSRASGILYNEAYIGKLVYNRTRFFKDPETGRRISRSLPESEWVITSLDSLRIISDDLWKAVQARKSLYRNMPLNKRTRPRHPFSGLIKCGECGSSFTIKGGNRLNCVAHRERGTCSNNRTITVSEIERRVLDGLRQRLLAPEIVATIVKEYAAERARLHERDRRRRSGIARQIQSITWRLERLVDDIANGTASRTTRERIIALEAERESLEREHADREEAARKVIELHPSAIARYQGRVATLLAALREDGPDRETALDTLRGLVERIDVNSLPERGQVALVAHGLIAGVVDYATRKQGTSLAIQVVAGEGLEPPTLGL